MSSIHNTNARLIHDELKSLINNKEFLSISKENLENLIPHTKKISPALFNMVYANKFNIFNNDKNFFDKINFMLLNIFKIQNNKISQLKASEIIGTKLAREYIDVCKNN
jgi:hypothetical protein